MRILVTGSEGFIGKNLIITLKEQQSSNNFEILKFSKKDSLEDLKELISQSDFIFHLAGENRPKDESLFHKTNTKLTQKICEYIKDANRTIPIVFSSSTQVKHDNYYGKSKFDAEEILKDLSNSSKIPVSIYRLPGVFGKWSKPNYNSVVATFCNNIAKNKPIKINDPSSEIDIVYIDDVIKSFVGLIGKELKPLQFIEIQPKYSITIGELADQIKRFKNSRKNLISERVGTGLVRALYSTYISYLPTDDFAYPLEENKDQRGIFVEMLKTKDSGQISFFSAHPGVERGGHYHHTKTEKFLVIKGKALFGFRNIVTNQKFELETSAKTLKIVETIPGWSHFIKNIGNEEMLVILWANEVFDHENPDTIWCEV